MNNSSTPSVLVAGGRGQMGKLFSRLLEERGCRTEVLEKGESFGRKFISGFDIVLLAVSMKEAVTAAREIAPLVGKDSLLCDINSLKYEICEVYKEYCRGEALGTHPMFGPTVSSLKGQKFVLCPVKEGRWTCWFERFIESQGACIVKESPKDHDRMMAIVQVLSHFATMVMGEAMRRSGTEVAETLKYTSPVYLMGLAVTGRQFAQDPELYGEIAVGNPWGREIRGHFIEAAEDLGEMISKGSVKEYKKRCEAIKGYFGEFSGEAMEISDFLIDALAGRESGKLKKNAAQD